MKEKNSKKKMIIWAVIFPAIVALMIFLVFRNCDFKGLARDISNAKIQYIITAVLCLCFFVVCESVNIGRITNAMGYHMKPAQIISYGASGFFFSGITPSSSGGQPMQLYYMNKDGINISHASLALLIELAGFQFVSLIIAGFGLIYNSTYIASLGKGIRLVVGIGLSADAAVFIILMLLIFSHKASLGIESFFCIILIKLKKEKHVPKVTEQIEEYREGSVYIKEHPVILLKNLLTAFLQMTAMYSITFFIFKALGCSGSSWIELTSLQAVLTAGIAVIPIPGVVGVGESGFEFMFASLFTSGLIMPGMALSRGISFYLGLMLTGCYLIIDGILRKKTSQKVYKLKLEEDVVAKGMVEEREND